MLAFYEQHKAQLKHQYQFISFITTTSLAFELPANFDWVFFNSPNAVVNFFGQCDSNKLVFKVASLGLGTSDELQKKGVSIDFQGEGTVDEVGKAFAQVINTTDKVLFPMSSLSKKRIQQHLPLNQVVDLISYQTNIKEQSIREVDAVLFTSPSNVEGFKKHNKFPKNVIAIGETTANSLIKLGLTPITLEDYHSDTWISFIEASIS